MRFGSPEADSRIAVSVAPMSPSRARSGSRVFSSFEGAKSSWTRVASSPIAAPKPSRKSSGHADHQADVAPLQGGAARA